MARRGHLTKKIENIYNINIILLVITLNVHETNLTGMSLDSKLYRLMINSRLRLDIEYSTQDKNLINQRSLHNYEVLHIDNMK